MGSKSSTNKPILPVIPNFCSTIYWNEALDECIKQIVITRTTGCNHKACVCVIWDCLIVGVEE